MDNKTDSLQGFAALSPAEQTEIIRTACEGFSKNTIGPDKDFNRRDYADGEAVYLKGETAPVMYKVMEGSVLLCEDEKGEKPICVVEKGELFGQTGAAACVPRTETAIARGNIKLLPIAKTALQTYIEQNPTDAEKILKSVQEARQRGLGK